MKHKALIAGMTLLSMQLFAAETDEQLQREIKNLKQKTIALQRQLNKLQTQVTLKPSSGASTKKREKIKSPEEISHHHNHPILGQSLKETVQPFHSTVLSVHALDAHPESLEFYPTALIADEHVVTYIAGTPVVSSPYLGDRPAFDGSDYIVNISSINRDIRLMQQRRRMYRAYQRIGYPIPNMPIIAISGKAEPAASSSRSYNNTNSNDLTLGASELDVAAALNDKVEAYMSIAYDDSPPLFGGQRVTNARLFLNMGFVNIGNLDETPYYFTAGQLFVPFGRFSSAMVSAPLTMQLARTKSRPFILGYKSQQENGPFAAVYGFKSDTTLGTSGIGGANLGYTFAHGDAIAEVGASVISSLTDSTGMQNTGAYPSNAFGGFGSSTNGNEDVKKIPGAGVHGSVSFDRYNLTAEWVGATSTFRMQDLSFNGKGANPQAAQLEAGVTFMVIDKPSSFAVGYQWSNDSLALNLPKQRFSGVFNTSFWKDTVESLEYRHDIDYKRNQYANGAAPAGLVNSNTIGSGRSSDTVLAQIGVFF